jgi:hypothetical protein
VLVTSDQNIKYQQNLSGRKLCLMVLGSDIWPIVREHAVSIKAAIDAATSGRYIARISAHIFALPSTA